MKINLFLENPKMPRTIFWQNILDIISSDFLDLSDSYDEIFVPAEDLAMETNWPRYGRGNLAYIRGDSHSLEENSLVISYFSEVLNWAKANPNKRVLLINMHPFFRVPLFCSKYENIFIADISLPIFERCCNKNTISIPALPIDRGVCNFDGPRKINIFFQGVASHPIRERLKVFDNQLDTVINIVNKSIHNELKLDAIAGIKDKSYSQYLCESNFAIVPRGDALFSYRLLEVISYGCIPVIISDGWVLPFDRQIDWSEISYILHEGSIRDYIPYLKSIPHDEITKRQKLIERTYLKYFIDLSAILRATLQEIKMI